jgi:hypothetical protein
MPQIRVVVVQAAPEPSSFKIHGQDKGRYYTEHEIDIDLKEESKNRLLEAVPTHVTSNPSPAHVTLLQRPKLI